MKDHAAVMAEATALVKELQESLALLRWTKLAPPPAPPGVEATFYQGLGAGWVVTVGSWKISETQSGYDGTCARNADAGVNLVRLPRETAEKIFRYAVEMVDA